MDELVAKELTADGKFQAVSKELQTQITAQTDLVSKVNFERIFGIHCDPSESFAAFTFSMMFALVNLILDTQ